MLDDDPPSADEDVARLRLAFCHTDLATLEEHGVVRWDRDENIVQKGPRFDAIPSLSELPNDYGGELPNEYLQ